MLAEIGARRRFHAIGVFAQIDLVEVDGEDVVLAEVFLQPVGEDGLLHLARIAALGGEKELLDELLGDGAAALAGMSLAEIVDRRAQDRHGVHAHVPVEGVVLGGEKGHGQETRHVLEADDIAFFMAQRAEDLAVAGQDGRGLGRIVVRDAGDVGQVARGPVEQGRNGSAAKQAAEDKKEETPKQELFPGNADLHAVGYRVFPPA